MPRATDLDVTAAAVAGLDVDVAYTDNGMDPLHLLIGLVMGQNGSCINHLTKSGVSPR